MPRRPSSPIRVCRGRQRACDWRSMFPKPSRTMRRALAADWKRQPRPRSARASDRLRVSRRCRTVRSAW
eukprot:6374411-Lingulodinium_polyedra.AAC.1